MKPPARIRARLLGRFALMQDGETAPPIGLNSRKATALIAYLAMQPEQSASREELAALLWGNNGDQQARNSLRQALALLRRDLPWPHLFVIGKDSVRMQAGIWSVDAREFDALTKSADASDLARAGRLFGGEFLAGFALDEEGFDEWLRDQRQRVELAATRLCESDASRLQVADGNGAIDFAERLIAIDPLREDRQRYALKLYARYRGRNEALARAKALAETLQRELGDKPEPETLALIEGIRIGAIASARPDAQTPSPSAGSVASPPQASSIRPIDTQAPPQLASRDLAAPPRRQTFPWTLRQQRGSAISAVLAAAALVFAAGIGLLMHNRPLPAHVEVSARSVSAATPADPIADPWRSPRLPSQSFIGAPNDKFNTPIAVLPFVTYGETAGSLQMLADQLTDDLTNMLSRVPGLRVISRQTMRSYQGKPIDISAIGAEFNVAYVLEGNIRATGDKIRVNAELINPRTRLAVWSDRIERDAADLHTVHDEIVGRLGRELQFSVLHMEAEQPSANPEIRTLLLRGWTAMFSASTRGLEGARLGQLHFTQALDRDPDSFVAKVGLAAVHITFSIHDFAQDREANLTKAEAILREALGRHPRSTIANYFMSAVHRLRGRLPDAVDSLERAIEHNPSHASSYAHLGFVLSRMGRAAEGLEHIRYAIRLSPRDPLLSFWLHYEAAAEIELARDEEAIEHFRQALALHPSSAQARAGLAAAFALSGNLEEAKSAVAKLHALYPAMSNEALLARLGSRGSQPLRFTEGLRLAFGRDSTSPSAE